MVDFSSEKCKGSIGQTETPSTSREIYSEESPIIGILTTGTRSSCLQWNLSTSWMRSQPQLRNDKYIISDAVDSYLIVLTFVQ